MNRLAKFFRVSGGIFLLLDMVAFFLPILVIKQENYPVIEYSGFDYVKKLPGGELEAQGAAVIVILIIIPFILSLFMGVIDIAVSPVRFVPVTGTIITALLDCILYYGLNILEPARLNEAQVYGKGPGMWMLAGFSIVAAVFETIGFIIECQDKKEAASCKEGNKEETAVTPGNLAEDIINVQQAAEVQNVPQDTGINVQEGQRGVMTGLSGDYKGAQIPFKPGETLKIGRDTSNDLVFSGSKRVSRFHCAITWLPDKQKYQILDKSSNGSFIEGRKECIPQNIAIFLEPGTILYFGSRENSFRLN